MAPLPALIEIHDRLLAAYGPQGWWPADGHFEMMVGAVLTQNTAWTNVERAILRLEEQGLLDPRSLLDAPTDQLAEAIRPAGYFNVKARRLQAFTRWYLDQGGFEPLARKDTRTLRDQLLAVHGIGPETADDILLYAFGRPVFVIDAYTRRIVSRVGHDVEGLSYEALRARFEDELPADVGLFNEYHALIVRHAKEHCRKKPLCSGCPLEGICESAHAFG